MAFCDDDTTDLLNFIFACVGVGVLYLVNLGWTVWLVSGGRQRVNKGRMALGIVVTMDKDKPFASQVTNGKNGMTFDDLELSGWNDAGYNAKFTAAKRVEFDEDTALLLLQLFHDVTGLSPAQMKVLRESGDNSKYRKEFDMDPSTRATLFSTALRWYKDNQLELTSGSKPKKEFSSEFMAALLVAK